MLNLLRVSVVLVFGLCTTRVHAQACNSAAFKSAVAKRVAEDQDVRGRLMAKMQKGEQDKVLITQAYGMDKRNSTWMHGYLNRCEWPKQSVVGETTAKGTWLLVQHADADPAFQVLAATKLKQAVLQGEAQPWDLASLVDRNRMLQEQPQLYGLQFREQEDGIVHWLPIEAPKDLDARRKEIGLPPFFCCAVKVAKDNPELAWPADVPFKPTTCQ